MFNRLSPSFLRCWRWPLGARGWAVTVNLLALLLVGLQGPVYAQGTAPVTRSTLTLGSQGDQVSELQAMLKLLGFYTGGVDGSYRDGTAVAVSAFQQAAGLQADGVVGTATWNRLLPSADSGSTGSSGSPSAFPNPNTSTATASPFPRPTQPVSNPNPSPTSPTPSSVSPQPVPTVVDFPVLRLGMQGPAVTRLQERLRRIGFFDGEADGVFGPQTQAAVQSAQSSFGLESDGVVGSATWSALLQ